MVLAEVPVGVGLPGWWQQVVVGQGLPPRHRPGSAMNVKWKSLVVMQILLVESHFVEGMNHALPLCRCPEYRRYWLPGVGEQMMLEHCCCWSSVAVVSIKIVNIVQEQDCCRCLNTGWSWHSLAKIGIVRPTHSTCLSCLTACVLGGHLAAYLEQMFKLIII